MEQNTGVTIALILVAVAVLIQAGMIVAIWVAVRKAAKDVHAVRDEIIQRVGPLTQSVTDTVTSVREPLRTIALNLADISRMVHYRASDVDSLVGELVDKSRSQVVRVDQMVTEVIRKVETTSDAVQRGVLAPVQEVSAVIKGMRAGLGFLLSHRPVTTVSETTQDEQLFI